MDLKSTTQNEGRRVIVKGPHLFSSPGYEHLDVYYL